MKKLTRYKATTLGGGNDYRMEPEEDGPLCTDYDVEKLEAVVRRCLADTEHGPWCRLCRKHTHFRHCPVPAALDAMKA